MSDSNDDDRSPADIVPLFPEDADELRGVARRYERSMVDIDQRLKDIVTILRDMRQDLLTERDRTDRLERDFVDHRAVVADLTKKRKARK